MKPLAWIALGVAGAGFIVYLFAFHEAPPRIGPISTDTDVDYLATREGPELERTVKRAIGMAGYSCASIRTTEKNVTDVGTVVGADCGSDGIYIVSEIGSDIRVLKK